MRIALNGITEDIGNFWNSFKWQSECLDPNRPGWLPKWIPTPEEKACQFGMYTSEVPPDPPMIHISAPQTEGQMTTPGSWDPLTAAQQTRVDYINAVNQTIGKYNEAERKKNEDTGLQTLFFVGAAAFVIGTVLQSMKR